ncbi:MAG: HEAT repeat domain-containing protein [Geitlerinemataceae cyanobacterium]
MSSASVRELVQSADYGDCISGVNRLNTLPYEEAMTLVEPLMAHENARVRYAAASKIATIGTADLPKSLELLRDRLANDSELDVKAAAADALGALQLKEAYEDLAAVYEATNDWILQLSIVAALSEMGEPKAIEVLLDALETDNDLLLATAIGAIGELKAESAVPRLEAFVCHDDSQVRFRTAQALGNLGGDLAREWLRRMTDDTDAQVVEQAKIALARA